MIKFVSIAAALALASGFAVAQTKIQSTTNPDAVQIQGNTNINAASQNNTAIASGVGNTAKNTTGAIKGGTQIQGNTNINAASKNNTAIATGVGNKAQNETGVIGGGK
ncbi:MAG: hypothetical protein RIR00_231 [Pseudomonadota bacterium]|jgi:hypothetical protein